MRLSKTRAQTILNGIFPLLGYFFLLLQQIQFLKSCGFQCFLNINSIHTFICKIFPCIWMKYNRDRPSGMHVLTKNMVTLCYYARIKHLAPNQCIHYFQNTTLHEWISSFQMDFHFSNFEFHVIVRLSLVWKLRICKTVNNSLNQCKNSSRAIKVAVCT